MDIRTGTTLSALAQQRNAALDLNAQLSGELASVRATLAEREKELAAIKAAPKRKAKPRAVAAAS